MTTSLRPWILSLFLFLLGPGSKGQNERIQFDHIGIEEGLLNENITAIFQDTKGFMWFGTFDGLYKYDAYSFTKYQLDPFDSNSLSQNFIYTIFEDQSGTIWVSTFEGLCKFNSVTGKFNRYKPALMGKFSNPNICAINEDSHGMLWLGTVTGEICRFDKQKGKFFENIELSHEQTGSMRFIFKDRAGTLWVGTNNGLFEINMIPGKEDFKITLHRNNPKDPTSLSSNVVISIFEDKRGIYWIATNNGLNSYDKKTGLFKRFQNEPGNNRSISTNNLTMWFGNTIKEDQEENLWISTEKGLNKLDSTRTIFTSYPHISGNSYSISSDHIRCLHIDREGVLWAGPVKAKLNKANLKKKGFGLITCDSSNINSLSNNEITSILEDSAGIIWIGTNGGGLNRWDKRTNQFTQYKSDPSDPKSLRSNIVNALLEDRHRHLWVCNGDVLSELNRTTGKFTHYNSFQKDSVGSHGRVIYSIAEDRQGLLWLGTGNGIRSFNEITGELAAWFYHSNNPQGISDGTATAIYADSKDNIWIGYGSRGTDRYDKVTKRFHHYIYNSANPNSISSNLVYNFFEDSRGDLWLGTWAGGLCRFDYKTENFKIYTDKHGLPSTSVFSIIEDNQKILWLGTRNGLSRFDPSTEIFTNYDYKDGLQGNVFSAGARERAARCKGKDGTLYFGGDNGINFFNPLQLKKNNVFSPVVITQFKVFDDVKDLGKRRQIALKYKENYFSFEFSTLSYSNPAKNQYAYKLEGVDKDWVMSGSRRYVSYTNINPGTYTFRVKGTNDDGVWNEDSAAIIIVINPPWWRTWWAYAIYVMVFILAIVLVIRNQRRKATIKEREKAREKELIQAREIEKAYTDLKLTQAQLIQSEKMASLGELTAGIAHEIQNPLNFVNNFSEVSKDLLDEMKIELDKGNSADAKELASDVIQNLEKINYHGKRADAIVKGMLQHSRSGIGVKESVDINALTDEYLRLSYHGLRAKDNTFNVTLKTDFDNTIGKMNIVPQDIGRVLFNLLTNAFYAVHEKKKQQQDYEPAVTIKTKKDADRVEIKVADNGNGIPHKVVDKIFQPFFTTKPTGQGTGLGLSLSYDIIKAHGGEIKVETKEGEGTEFIIKLPMR